MNDEYSEEMIIELLIQEVEKYPILYNSVHKHFMDVQKKEYVWSELSLKYNINAKRRFRSLRDRYVREKKKIDLQLLISKTVEYPNWRYFSHLTFLDKFLRKNNNRNQSVHQERDNSIIHNLYQDQELGNIDKKSTTHNLVEQEIEHENFDNKSVDLDEINSTDYIANNDIEVQPNLEEINPENKCGQIYLENGKFIFLCDFCEDIFYNINIYMEHILNYHKSNETNINYLIENIKEDPDKQQRYISNEIADLSQEDTINYFDVNPRTDDPLNVNTLKYEIEFLEENSVLLDSDNEPNISKSLINYEKPPKLLNENNEYPCTKCDKTYTIYKSLRDHFRINHTTKCQHCFQKFGNLHSLQIHLSEKHQDIINKNKSNKQSIEISEKSIEFNTNYETEFDINYLLPSIKHKPQQSIADEPVKLKNSEGRYICTLCDNVTYARFENIKRHYSNVHLDIARSRYYCDQCDKIYHSRFQLRAHMNIHKGLRPYKCHLCTADFTHPQYLNFHIRIHLNDKRYPCKYCGKKFIRPYERIYHERSNHTNEKLYQCDDCGQTFIKNSQLNRHKNIKHNPNYVRPLYECDICKNTFTTKESMLKHKLIHEGKKPFDCDICGSKFRARHDVNVHKKIHSDIKNYVCKICDKRFAQGPGLYSHMKSHGIALSSKKDSNIFL